MSAFVQIDWRFPDALGIVAYRGVLPMLPPSGEACDRWLAQNGYKRHEFDFSGGISLAVSALGKHLRWVERFGYSLAPESRKLDALRDGFEIVEDRVVFALRSFEHAWSENTHWSRGFLSIVSECSLYQLALGKRFFATLLLEPDSLLVGQAIDELTIGSPCHFHVREA